MKEKEYEPLIVSGQATPGWKKSEAELTWNPGSGYQTLVNRLSVLDDSDLICGRIVTKLAGLDSMLGQLYQCR